MSEDKSIPFEEALKRLAKLPPKTQKQVQEEQREKRRKAESEKKKKD